jgi:hypothetical protein
MKNKKQPTPQQHKMQKKWMVLGGLGLVIFLIASWWLYSATRVYPLGDKLEYIGKSDYGCPLICDANPGSTYYYGTDMSAEEVVRYFKGAVILNAPDERNWQDMGDDFWIDFKDKRSDKRFSTIYYVNGGNTARTLHLSPLNKAHVIKINQEWYDTAHNSL